MNDDEEFVLEGEGDPTPDTESFDTPAPRRRGRPSKNDPRFQSSRSRSLSSRSSSRRSVRQRTSASTQDSSMSMSDASLLTRHPIDFSTGNSIRENARNPSVSAGFQSNVTSRRSFYNLTYHQNNIATTNPSGTDTTNSDHGTSQSQH
eukprot:scaffold7232_cov63-Cyclotella_meneghiniana.AAC.12